MFDGMFDDNKFVVEYNIFQCPGNPDKTSFIEQFETENDAVYFIKDFLISEDSEAFNIHLYHMNEEIPIKI